LAYNPNIPQVTDNRTQSAGQILANFQTINRVFADNHIALTVTDNVPGRHSVLTMRPQSVDPTTTANNVALYNKIVSSVPELFFRPNNNQTPIQLTYPSISTGLASTNPDVYNTDQYTFLAGPFV